MHHLLGRCLKRTVITDKEAYTNMKRRFIPLVLCLLLLMTCLTGCGGDGGGATRSASLDSFAFIPAAWPSAFFSSFAMR